MDYAFGLLRHSGWVAPALLLFLLRLWIKAIPWYLLMALLGVWLLAALLFTLFFGWASSTGGVPDPPQENKNPYSAKNGDVFPGMAETEAMEAGEYICVIRYLGDGAQPAISIEPFVDPENEKQDEAQPACPIESALVASSEFPAGLR